MQLNEKQVKINLKKYSYPNFILLLRMNNNTHIFLIES